VVVEVFVDVVRKQNQKPNGRVEIRIAIVESSVSVAVTAGAASKQCPSRRRAVAIPPVLAETLVDAQEAAVNVASRLDYRCLM